MQFFSARVSYHDRTGVAQGQLPLLQRFGSIEDVRSHCQTFFASYNSQHCHSGIGHMTPHSVHYGQARLQMVLFHGIDGSAGPPATVHYAKKIA
jgi:hypothetical protein